MGLLFGRNQVADSAFRSIESEYRAACDLVRAEPEELPILYGLDYQGVWYIPLGGLLRHLDAPRC